jgi:translation initiation factor IF-1
MEASMADATPKQKQKEDDIEVQGVVIDSLRGRFQVEITHQDEKPIPSKFTVSATIGGKLRVNNIKIVPGDKVKVSLSPYDLTRGRITYRMKE